MNTNAQKHLQMVGLTESSVAEWFDDHSKLQELLALGVQAEKMLLIETVT
jgi:hypothetical protein